MSVDRDEPFEPNWCLHPGGTIRKVIQDRGWKQSWVAAQTGVSQKHLSQIIHARTNYSAAWAIRFAELVGVSPQFIWNLQCNYLLDLARGKKDVTRDDLEGL